jgi:hypothetical protein
MESKTAFFPGILAGLERIQPMAYPLLNGVTRRLQDMKTVQHFTKGIAAQAK